MAPARHRTREILSLTRAGLAGDAPTGWQAKLAALAHELADLRREAHPHLLRETAVGREHPARALEVLDALRWLDRVGYHSWRLYHHLGGNAQPWVTPANRPPPRPELFNNLGTHSPDGIARSR